MTKPAALLVFTFSLLTTPVTAQDDLLLGWDISPYNAFGSESYTRLELDIPTASRYIQVHGGLRAPLAGNLTLFVVGTCGIFIDGKTGCELQIGTTVMTLLMDELGSGAYVIVDSNDSIIASGEIVLTSISSS